MYEETLRWFLITVFAIFGISVIAACLSVLMWLLRVERTDAEEDDWRKILHAPPDSTWREKSTKVRILKDFRSTDGQRRP